jgi:hypothetical protein
MAKLIYPALASLDGYVADEEGKFDVRLPLELLDERRFGNGMVYLRYRAA